MLGLYVGVGVFDHEIWAPVEPTIAGVVWNMVDTGNLAVPFVNHDAWVEKPPFYYWLAWASAGSLGGLDAGTLRLPAALLGLGCLGFVFWTSRRTWGTEVACITTLAAAASVMLWDTAHRASSDISATFFTFLCFALFTRSLHRTQGSTPDRRQPWDLAFCITLAASFYAKNVFTFLLVLPPVVVFLLLARQPRRLATLGIITAVALVVLLTPWIVAVYLEGGTEPLRIIFYDNTLGRFLPMDEEYALQFTTTMSDAMIAEKEPALFYVPRLFAYPLPWTAIFLVALVDLFRTRRAHGDFERFLLVGVLTMPIVLTLSSAKSTDYMVPILFFDVLIIGRLVASLIRGRPLEAWERVLVLANVLVALVLIAVFPIVLAILFGSATTLVFAPPAALTAWWLWSRLRQDAPNARWCFDFGASAVVAATLGLAIAIPAVDVDKSYGPYFDDVQPLAANRHLVTTFHEINRLPLINYYLERRAETFETFAPVATLLEGNDPIAAFVRCHRYAEHRVRLEATPGISMLAEPERKDICFVWNHARAPRLPLRRTGS
ncbi:MAG: glycosyltransferase family 39 protein [Candidatus Binatia bacterium]|nr:glycosyltransferase family 39 protein [Candidatus Binatia bacterium]